jgi:pimeloyl-ACP methyl ester carboxylesterase
LYGHGIASDNALQDLTPENYLESAKHAVSIGKCLGEKVILMATSTGGSLALIIASANPEIAGLILYSPNIDFRDNSSFMLIRPWGLQIARIVQRSSSMESDDPKNVQMYWQSRYRLEALVSVKALLNATMNKSTFARIKQPIFVGYYYKNDVEQDNRVSVVRILQMFEQVETPVALKRQISFPNAGVHPIASSIVSKDICTVRLETFAFAEDILGLVPIAVSTKD